jgi:alkylation response protein AidB-like acyl-CoA dehydrogenase
MALVLNDEQTMLRDNARSFLGRNAPVAHLRKLRDERGADGFSRPLWKEFANLGWTGILIPPDHDGLGLGHVEAGVVMEEIGRTLPPRSSPRPRSRAAAPMRRRTPIFHESQRAS